MSPPVNPRTLKVIELLKTDIAVADICLKLGINPSHVHSIAHNARQRHGEQFIPDRRRGKRFVPRHTLPNSQLASGGLPIVVLNQKAWSALYSLARRSGAVVLLTENIESAFDVRVVLGSMDGP